MQKDMDAKVKNWLRLMDQGIIKNRFIEILINVKNNPNTNINRLRDQTGIKHQSLTAVLSIIMDHGLIKVVGQTIECGNDYSVLRFVSDPEEQIKVKNKRKYEKYILWCKTGLSDYSENLNIFVVQELKAILENDRQR